MKVEVIVKKIKICHICSYYENILFDNLVSSQLDFSDPKVFFFKKYGTDKQYDKKYIDEIECYNNIDRVFFFLKAFKVFRAYKKIYSGTRFDLLFAHSLFANGFIAYLAYKRYKIPYIIMVQNTDINVFYKWKPYLSGIAKKIIFNSSAIVFASASYRDLLISQHIPEEKRDFVRSKSIIIPYGIEDVFFRNKNEKVKKTLKDKVHVICVGLICKNKNQVNLAKAIDGLNREGNDIDLKIIGKIENEKIKSNLLKYKFLSLISYMDKKELVKEYQKADIFALTSHTETFGLVYAEALSQGLPIIYSRGQGFDRQFDEGFVGTSANSRSVQSIKDAIRKVINNFSDMEKNTKIASRRFEWSSIALQYKKLYNTVLSKELEL